MSTCTKNLVETLAALTAGAALLPGCGAAATSVGATEVPAATEIKPSNAAPVENKTSGAAAGSLTESPAPATQPAAPAASANAAGTPAPSTPAAAAKKPAAPAKKAAHKQTASGDGGCGQGTCAN
jgi:translation initiation factor IF-2